MHLFVLELDRNGNPVSRLARRRRRQGMDGWERKFQCLSRLHVIRPVKTPNKIDGSFLQLRSLAVFKFLN